jgi:hypothetical protein
MTTACRLSFVGLPLMIATLAALAASSASTGGQSPSPAAPSGLIVGQVVDAATSRPIAGAVVNLLGSATIAAVRTQNGVTMSRGEMPPLPRILTSADGYFVFRDLPRGAYTVTASKAGYAEGASGRRRPAGPSQAVTLEEGQRAGDVIVRVWKLGAISGTVVDERGEPIVGMIVRAFRRSPAGGRGRFVGTGASGTDDRGMYRIAGLLPGEYMVCACPRQSSAPLEFTTAVRAAGSSDPFFGGMQIGETILSMGPGTAVAGIAGSRLITYPLAFHPQGQPASEAGTLPLTSGEERTGVDLQLNAVPSVRVSGALTSLDGVIAGVPIRLVPSGVERIALDQESPTTLTNRAGNFTLPAVPAGQYALRVIRRVTGFNPPANADDVLWAHVPLVIGGSDVNDIAVVLQNGLRISGHFEFEGKGDRPVAAQLRQVPVIIDPVDGVPADSPMMVGPNPVDVTGEFRTVGLPAGRYFLRVGGSPAGWMFKSAMYQGTDLSETPVDLHDHLTGVVITFTDRWTGIRGAVRTAKNQPDDGALVLLFPSDPQRWSNYGPGARRMRSTRTSASGEYSFTSLPAGDYYVVAIPDEHAVDWQDTGSLDLLARMASRLTIAEGDQRVVDLRRREVR